jgi:hypothetical protein
MPAITWWFDCVRHIPGSVHTDRLYAIPLKNGNVEYELDARQPEVTVTCVRALFPHLGYQPCWYVRRNSQKPIPMVILTSVSARL